MEVVGSSHHFQELGRLHRSSGHTHSPSSPGLMCFRHIHCFRYSDCSGTAAGLTLTHPIRLYNYHVQYLTQFEVSSDSRCSENNTLHDIRRFLAENIDAFAINWTLKHAVSRLKSSNIGGVLIWISHPRKIFGGHVPPDP